LNVDHTLRNEDEVERLHQLGFPKEQLVNSTRFGQQLYTRCIGDYSVKGGYKDNEQMRLAITTILSNTGFIFYNKNWVKSHLLFYSDVSLEVCGVLLL